MKMYDICLEITDMNATGGGTWVQEEGLFRYAVGSCTFVPRPVAINNAAGGRLMSTETLSTLADGERLLDSVLMAVQAGVKNPRPAAEDNDPLSPGESSLIAREESGQRLPRTSRPRLDGSMRRRERCVTQKP